jgi:Kef-type K+ transport system membrane component KefB
MNTTTTSEAWYFQRYRSAALAFGLMTFLAPFLFSVFASKSLVGLGTLAAILMGSVCASHSLVAYPTVRQAGITGNRAVATSVGATVITDTLALLVLAVVPALARDQESGGNSSLVVILVKLLIILALLIGYCMVFLPRFVRWLYAGPGQDRLLHFVFVVGTLASAGLLAVLVGMEGIVGAFFAGLGPDRMIPNGGRLMEQVEFFGSSFFIPAFLIAYSGFTGHLAPEYARFDNSFPINQEKRMTDLLVCLS